MISLPLSPSSLSACSAHLPLSRSCADLSITRSAHGSKSSGLLTGQPMMPSSGCHAAGDAAESESDGRAAALDPPLPLSVEDAATPNDSGKFEGLEVLCRRCANPLSTRWRRAAGISEAAVLCVLMQRWSGAVERNHVGERSSCEDADRLLVCVAVLRAVAACCLSACAAVRIIAAAGVSAARNRERGCECFSEQCSLAVCAQARRSQRERCRSAPLRPSGLPLPRRTARAPRRFGRWRTMKRTRERALVRLCCAGAAPI